MLQSATAGAATVYNRGFPTAPVYMSNSDVQRRFGVSAETLKRWRLAGTGPKYVRLGNRIKYCLADVMAYETSRTFVSSADETASRAA